MFVLSLKIVNCRQVTTSIKKTLVNQIQENTATAVCTPTLTTCKELQNEVNCAKCIGSGQCKCKFTCSEAPAGNGCSVADATRVWKSVPYEKGETLCKPICASLQLTTTDKKSENAGLFSGSTLREQFEFLDNNFPGGTTGFTTFAALGAAVPPPIPMFPPIGLPQPVGLQSNIISSIN